MTTTTWPRAQHWTTGKDGFRVSVLLYKTSREHCATCKTFPAMHFVSADGRGLYEGFSGCAHFCDGHRPPKGPLPPLDCQKLLRGGDVVIYEHLAAKPEHGCGLLLDRQDLARSVRWLLERHDGGPAEIERATSHLEALGYCTDAEVSRVAALRVTGMAAAEVGARQ